MDSNPYATPKSQINGLSIIESTPRFTSILQSWIITISILFLSLCGTVLALMCIFALPDGSVKPLEGSIFFLGGAIIQIAFLFFRWKKGMTISSYNQIIVNENISDKIIKWITAFFSIGYAFWGFAIALICIYALPDKSMQPKTGAIYFIGGAFVVASFVFVVWKNWTSKKILSRDGE